MIQKKNNFYLLRSPLAQHSSL